LRSGSPIRRGGESIYVVKPGDTLWNITERFFDNPLLWPRLWELNPFIDNPHLIFPGEVLNLNGRTTLPVVKINPQRKEMQLDLPRPPPPVYYYSRGGHEGFIMPDEWQHTGTVLTSEPPKIMLTKGDIVFVNMGFKDNVKKGDVFTVFRTGKVILHPFSGRKLGNKVAILGELEIQDVVDKKLSSAVITTTYRVITRGAFIRPKQNFVKEVVMKKGVEMANGIIVETFNATHLVAAGDVVFVDLGEVDNIVPGNTFSIYKYPRKSYDPDKGDFVNIPGALVGRMVALSVNEEVSACIIIKQSRQIEKGDIVSLELQI